MTKKPFSMQSSNFVELMSNRKFIYIIIGLLIFLSIYLKNGLKVKQNFLFLQKLYPKEKMGKGSNKIKTYSKQSTNYWKAKNKKRLNKANEFTHLGNRLHFLKKLKNKFFLKNFIREENKNGGMAEFIPPTKESSSITVFCWIVVNKNKSLLSSYSPFFLNKKNFNIIRKPYIIWYLN